MSPLSRAMTRGAPYPYWDRNTQAEPPQMQTEILKDYISRDQLAIKIGKSVKTLVRWENDGRGPPVTRIGRDVLYSIPSVQKWLRDQERASKAAA
jgi:hypothetical protein